MAQKSKMDDRFAALLALLMGIGLFGAGAWNLKSNYDFAHHAVAAVGTVISVDSFRDSKNTEKFRPTFSLIDPSGAQITTRTSLYAPGYDYAVGEQVDILYNPDDPGEMRIDSWLYQWGVWIVMLIVGTSGLVFSVVILRHYLKTQARRGAA